MLPPEKRAATTIDSLPDVIRAKIVGFLPTQSAIQTSVLSKRWEKIWTLSPCLCFVARSAKSIVSISNSLDLALDRSSISTFHLVIDFLPRRPNDINDLVSFSLDRKPKDLSIRFIGMDQEHSLADDFYVCDSAERLMLQVAAPDLHRDSQVSWPRLTNLSLWWSELSQESLNKVLLGCPLLQSLTLCDCDRINLVDLSNSTSTKKLDIVTNGYAASEQLTLRAPHLAYLGLRLRKPCVLVDISSLKEAKLEFFSVTSIVLHDAMAKLEKTRKLTFGGSVLKMMSDSPLPEQLKVEDLTLDVDTEDVPNVIPGVERLLRISPAIKKLTIDLMMLEVRPWHYYHIRESDEDQQLEPVISLIKSVREHTTNSSKVVVRLAGYIPESKFEKLRKMTHQIGSKNSVSIVLSRSSETFFDNSTCPDHRF